MPMPTKEQWAEVEAAFKGVLSRVELKADGYDVVAAVHTIAPLKQGIVIYVNGWTKGEWCNGVAEEAKKFLQERSTYLFGQKARDAAKKAMKRRGLPKDLKEMYRRTAEEKFSTWLPYWTDPKAFTRHLRKTCTDIEIIQIGGGL